MQQYTTLKSDYNFTKEEALILQNLHPRMEKLADEFIDGFYDYIWGLWKNSKILKK